MDVIYKRKTKQQKLFLLVVTWRDIPIPVPFLPWTRQLYTPSAVLKCLGLPWWENTGREVEGNGQKDSLVETIAMYFATYSPEPGAYPPTFPVREGWRCPSSFLIFCISNWLHHWWWGKKKKKSHGKMA